MNFDEAQKLLDKMAGTRSQYEFDYFVVEDQGNIQRQLRNILRDKERLTARLQSLQLTMAIEKYRCSKIEDTIERSLAERLIDANDIMHRREIEDIKADLAQCDAWLDRHKDDGLDHVASDLNSGESEHWSSQLGRQSAVEVLADNKVSAETMRLMCLLPLEDYRKCVTVMHQFAEFIKQTTVRVEQQFTTTRPDAVPTSQESNE